MTEHEWNGCTSPVAMLNFLVRMVCDRSRINPWGGPALDRKLRLFLCACGRRLWPLLTDPRSRQAIETAERFADVGSGRDALRTARQGAAEAADVARAAWVLRRTETTLLPWRAAHLAVAVTDETLGQSVYSDWVIEQVEQVALLREIVGYPFGPVTIEPAVLAWREGLVPRLAGVIHARRHYDDLPILADALEEAGCNEPRILEHCRRPGGHVRGCWVIDRLLGRG